MNRRQKVSLERAKRVCLHILSNRANVSRMHLKSSALNKAHPVLSSHKQTTHSEKERFDHKKPNQKQKKNNTIPHYYLTTFSSNFFPLGMYLIATFFPVFVSNMRRAWPKFPVPSGGWFNTGWYFLSCNVSSIFIYVYISYSAPPKATKTNRIQTVLMSFDCAFKIPLSFLSLSRIYALIRKSLS